MSKRERLKNLFSGKLKTDSTKDELLNEIKSIEKELYGKVVMIKMLDSMSVEDLRSRLEVLRKNLESAEEEVQ